jgi:hypothetical protein
MAVTRTEWNTIVVGNWNRAILTPAWIGKHLFGLDTGTPVEVNVPLDEYRPYQIKHGGVVVIPSSIHLIVKPVDNEFLDLGKAAAIAAKTIGELPRTPLTAAGINCAFKADGPLDKLSEITTHSTDNPLVDADFRIASRGSRRSLKWHEGHINVLVDDDDDEGRTIQFNFHLSDKQEANLVAWLSRPIEEIEDVVKKILKIYLDIELEDTTYAKTE